MPATIKPKSNIAGNTQIYVIRQDYFSVAEKIYLIKNSPQVFVLCGRILSG